MSEKIFIVTTHGLEAVSATEIATLPELTIGPIGYRRIRATCTGSLASLFKLQTVDDVFLDLGTWHDIGRHRHTLSRFRSLSSQLDLCAAAAKCARARAMPRS